jgi:hypothetical protein
MALQTKYRLKSESIKRLIRLVTDSDKDYAREI